MWGIDSHDTILHDAVIAPQRANGNAGEWAIRPYLADDRHAPDRFRRWAFGEGHREPAQKTRGLLRWYGQYHSHSVTSVAPPPVVCETCAFHRVPNNDGSSGRGRLMTGLYVYVHPPGHSAGANPHRRAVIGRNDHPAH